MSLVLAFFSPPLNTWSEGSLGERGLWLGALIAAAALTYLGVLVALGLRPRQLLRK